jgi:hypothetical protein
LLLLRLSQATRGAKLLVQNFLAVNVGRPHVVKDLQIARSAVIFPGMRALSGFSPEQRGGTSFLIFLAFNGGRHGRC